MKTIKQIADELGVSKQKVYRFIVRNHITASSEVKRSKLYDESAEMLIKQGFLEDELHQKSHHEVHQNHINDTVSEAVIELLRKELEQKNEQLQEKDRQIREKDRQISEMQAQLSSFKQKTAVNFSCLRMNALLLFPLLTISACFLIFPLMVISTLGFYIFFYFF